MFTLLVLGSIVSLLISCHKKAFPVASGKKSDNKQSEVKKDLTPEQLSQGEAIFNSKCNKCHEFHEPSELTRQKWDEVLPTMLRRAKLNEDDAALVAGWINKNARS